MSNWKRYRDGRGMPRKFCLSCLQSVDIEPVQAYCHATRRQIESVA